MYKPDYTLKFNNGRKVPKNEGPLLKVTKIIIAICVIIIIGGLILYDENIMEELSIFAWFGLIGAGFYVVRNGGKERKECYSELWFYQDFLMLYVPCCYIGKGKNQREYRKIYYKNVKEAYFRKNAKKIDIYGEVEIKFYDINKEGNINNDPSYHKTKDSCMSLHTIFEPDIDFVNEIENHAPIRLHIEE